MAIQCFTVVRALRATAHHAAHRLARHHIHHARRAVVHRVALLHASKLPAVVCMVVALATVGGSGFVAGGKMPGSPAPNDIGSTMNSPLSLGSGGVDSSRVDRPSTSPIASLPKEVGSSPDAQFSYDWDEVGDLWHTPSTFAWNEIGSPRGRLQSMVWDQIGNLPDIPSSSSPNEGSSFLDTPRGSVAVPEPASISVLVASLFGVGVLTRRNRTNFVALRPVYPLQ